MLHVHLLTLFAEFFSSPLSCGLMAKAREAGILDFSFVNPRKFTQDRHHHVDDRPFGGGAGMVMQVEPLVRALQSIETTGRILVPTPSGRPISQNFVRELAREEHITIICGRYEGIDARIEELFCVEPVSCTDCVLNSGDAAALILIEAIARLQPGFMGKESSAEEESFECDLLEYPQYTRPECFGDCKVPSILLSGNHGEIARFRRQKRLERTLRFRKDLLQRALLTAQDASFLASLARERIGRRLSFCLVHHPVRIEGRRAGTSSLTNLDIHDIARISASYGLGPFFVVTPLADQRRLLEDILAHWRRGQSPAHPDRAYALGLVRPAETIEQAYDLAEAHFGVRPLGVASSASWPRKPKCPVLGPAQVRSMLTEDPVLLFLGTAQGLAEEVLNQCSALLRPIRFMGFNHLSVRSAAAILADRILGDFD